MLWAEMSEGSYPLLSMLYAVPNGGYRHPAVAARMKQEGVKPGVPDLCLPVARCGLHGLYIEMKARDGRLSKHQQRWRDLLIAQGYGVAVVYGFDEARNVLIEYLNDRWSLTDHIRQKEAQ